jgi:DNA-directed RNA polymerase subunit RPC12/RpoP
MKAITCTQCGAIIEDVSPNSLIINCDYCGARILLDPRPVEIKPPVAVPAPDFEIETPQTPQGRMIATGVAVALLVPLLITFVIFVSRPTRPTPAKVYSAPATPYVYSAPSLSTTPEEPPKPVPVVNYQPRISWDGPNDLEYFDSPEVDISSVSHLTSEEVKKTVFKDRVVKLRVVINTEGEIDTVETISGHPILVEAAAESARRSIFHSRSKPTTRVLTYTFRVLKD